MTMTLFSGRASGYYCCSSSSTPSFIQPVKNINNAAAPSRLLLRSSAAATATAFGCFPLRVAVSVVTDEYAYPSPSPSAPGFDNVTRRLILLRHAHSSFTQPALRDHDRPLTSTGQSDAAKVALKLQQLGWMPHLILLSDAARTRETLKIMQESVPTFLDAEVRFIPSFYSIAAMDGQTVGHLQLSVCKHSTDDLLTVMCMGHNRGWEEAASILTGTTVELKTCNAALLEATGKSWEEAFALAGLGGWKLQGIVKPSDGIV
ncbi:unnamed protein product [Linum trigynum]|uniref:Phosphoglycerate mutase family protein n=1 Tax=Linum trigynum TaxID=586398 RepID=A0AAV2DXK5_9ROSI